jgi:putative ABC transport system permease protein
VDARTPPGLILNETMVKRLGFASPRAALGREILPQRPWAGLPVRAVVPDLWLHPVDVPIQPSIYVDKAFDVGTVGISWTDFRLVHIRLSGAAIPETLAAIDRLWRETGGEGAIDRFFFDRHMEERYAGMMRQAQMFAVFAGVAIFLACLGLAGIAVATAERRTKEIGVRKAMGASSAQIAGLLLWQFSRPVLWASLIAWPLAWWLMQRWLSAYLFRIDLDPRLFIAVSAVTLLIAILAVGGQAIAIARRKPVAALRYE